MELNSLLFSFTPSLWTRQLFFQVWFRKGICLSSFLLIRFRTIRILFAMQMCRDASLCISRMGWKSKKIHQSALRCKGRPFSSDSFDILTLWQNALLSSTRTYTGVTTRNRLYMTRRIMQFPNRPLRTRQSKEPFRLSLWKGGQRNGIPRHTCIPSGHRKHLYPYRWKATITKEGKKWKQVPYFVRTNDYDRADTPVRWCGRVRTNVKRG